MARRVTARQRAASRRNLQKARARRRRRAGAVVGATFGTVGVAAIGYAGANYSHGYRNSRAFGMGRKEAFKSTAKYGHHIPVAKVRNFHMSYKLRKMGF